MRRSAILAGATLVAAVLVVGGALALSDDTRPVTSVTLIGDGYAVRVFPARRPDRVWCASLRLITREETTDRFEVCDAAPRGLTGAVLGRCETGRFLVLGASPRGRRVQATSRGRTVAISSASATSGRLRGLRFSALVVERLGDDLELRRGSDRVEPLVGSAEACSNGGSYTSGF